VPGKLKIVVSDFHLGAGPPDPGENPLEDFIADEAFARFLEMIRAESDRDGKEVELIINGDFFEFLRVPAVGVFQPGRSYPSAAYSDSSQESSLRRLDLITAGHPMVFDALSDFFYVEAPRRRMTLIKGNHDVNLYWPRVKQRLREVLGATGRRASMLLFAERYVSREGIYVEHGHQYAERLSRWDNFDDPRDPANLEQLIYPPGSQFGIDFFSTLGRERVWAESVKPPTALIWYSLAWDFDFAARMLVALARHVSALTGGAERAAYPALDALCGQLSDPATCQALATRYRTSADFRREFHTQIGQVLVPAASPPGMFAWPGSPEDESAVEIARTEIQQIQASMRRVALRLARAQGARVLVFGHTHRPYLETLSDGITLVNCGSWAWLSGYDPLQADIWLKLLAEPHQVAPRHRLTYARIDYDERDEPHAQLLEFAPERSEAVAPERVKWANILARLRARG
jgi:UDP-2,3-diacylglucosamine pyrophosphatase LpxH